MKKLTMGLALFSLLLLINHSAFSQDAAVVNEESNSETMNQVNSDATIDMPAPADVQENSEDSGTDAVKD